MFILCLILKLFDYMHTLAVDEGKQQIQCIMYRMYSTTKLIEPHSGKWFRFSLFVPISLKLLKHPFQKPEALGY